MEDLHKLRDALDRVADKLHLKREQFAIIPGEPPHPDRVNVVFRIDPDILISEQERQRRQTEDAFADIAANFDGPKEDDRVAEAKRQAQELFDQDDWKDL